MPKETRAAHRHTFSGTHPNLSTISKPRMMSHRQVTGMGSSLPKARPGRRNSPSWPASPKGRTEGRSQCFAAFLSGSFRYSDLR